MCKQSLFACKFKQDVLAFETGEDWNQKKISLLEQKETIEPAILQQVSAALKIPVEAFRNFDEEQAANFITNTFNDQSNGLQLLSCVQY